VYDKIHGRGQYFTGTQMVASIVTTASDSQLWTGSPSSVMSHNAIGISPDLFNSRLAVIASGYQKYRFTEIDIVFDSLVAATQAGGCALCVSNTVEDSAITSYAAVQDVSPSTRFAFRDGRVTLTYRFKGDDLWLCKYDVTSVATERQTVQGVLYGYPSSSSLGAITMGTLSMRYRVELFYPTSNLSLAAFCRCSEEEFKFLRTQLESYRTQCALLKDEKKVISDNLMPVLLKQNKDEKVETNSASTNSSTSSSSSGVTSAMISKGWFRA